MFLLRAFVVWIVIIGVEMVHGILRTLVLAPLIGDFPSRQFSVLTGSLLIFFVANLFIRWIHAETNRRLLVVGLVWVALTLFFEIGLGRFVLNFPWDRVAEDYDFTRGGLLGIGLAFMAIAPLLVTKLRMKNHFLHSQQ